MKNYGVLGSFMLYEAGKTPQLSPLAPYNMGHCHFPLFHGIWDQVTIVCDQTHQILTLTH